MLRILKVCKVSDKAYFNDKLVPLIVEKSKYHDLYNPMLYFIHLKAQKPLPEVLKNLHLTPTL
jgi:hypothetical protein